MPLLKLVLPALPAEDKQRELLAALSTLAAECIGKPEQYVMVTLGTAAFMMSGREGKAAWAEIHSIGGLSGPVNRQISRKLCELLEQTLGIPSNRVYVNFTNVPAENWGWNGDTFG